MTNLSTIRMELHIHVGWAGFFAHRLQHQKYRRLNEVGRKAMPTLLGLIMLTGCSEPTIQKLEGPAQGTTYHISYWAEEPVDDKAIKADIENEFTVIDKLLSNYRPDSTIETFNSTENTGQPGSR